MQFFLPAFVDISAWLQHSYPFHDDILAASHQEIRMELQSMGSAHLSIAPCVALYKDLCSVKLLYNYSKKPEREI